MISDSLDIILYNQHIKKLYDEESEIIVKKYGLHKIEFEILFFIHSTCLNRAKDIVENTHFSKAHISKAIERLSNSGYLVCVKDNNDKRCVRLKLTDKAYTILNDIVEFYQHMVNILLKDITSDEMTVLNNIVKKIINNINVEISNNNNLNLTEMKL